MTNKTGKAGKVVPLKKSKCPNCAKVASAKHHPFCSERCANLDLGRWLKEEYRNPTNEGPDAFMDGEEDA